MSSFFKNSSTAGLMVLRSVRSRDINANSPVVGPDMPNAGVDLMFSAAFSKLGRDRPAQYTLAFFQYSIRASSRPMPEEAPVMMYTFHDSVNEMAREGTR